MKLQEYINKVSNRLLEHDLFYGHGTDNAIDEAAYLVYISLGFDLSKDIDDGRELSDIEISEIDRQVSERIEERKPVAYVLGKSWFAGRLFNSDKRALIPRSPIAELIRNRFEPLLADTPGRILDLCTGGGCIGIAAALEFANSNVDLADISIEALALADSNIALHNLSVRVRSIRSDTFESLEGKYDLIVSNPPYVSRQEHDQLPREYAHEPKMGLISDDNGLALPLRILREAADFLNDDGVLILEVGYSHELLAQRLKNVPLLWLEFEYGGEGVLALTAAQLQQYRASFK